MDFSNETIQGRYLVHEQIGEGGASTVYRAQDLALERTVAIKFLRPELRADPSFVTRFEREARSAAQLNHPNIVPVYDYGETSNTFYLVLQYVPGGDLRERLLSGRSLPILAAVRLAGEIAEGLGAAHRLHIVHRDVKPANILLTPDGHARVTDFGIAKMLDVPSVTTVATVLGTATYLAPEQASDQTIGPATDVYALGVVLFEMLAGHPPFRGESYIQLALQHVNAEPPDLTEVNPSVPVEVAALVRRALAKDPAQRFEDGAAFALALRRAERALIDALPPPTSAPVTRATTADARRKPAAAPASNVAPPRGAAPRASAPVAPASGLTVGAPSVGREAAPVGPTREVVVTRSQTRMPEVAPHEGSPRRSRVLVPLVLAGGVGILLVALVGWLLGSTTSPAAIGGNPRAGEVAGIAVERATPSSSTPSPSIEESGVSPMPVSAPAVTATVTREPVVVAAPTVAPTATSVPPTATAPPPTAVPPTAVPPTAAPAPAASASGQVVIDDDAFQGGFSAPRQYRGRTARWVYGALSPYGQMTASFTVDGAPGAGTLTLVGVDSENGPQTPMEIRINDTTIYRGGNPLRKDYYTTPEAPWGETAFEIPPGVLHAGRNTLTISNQVQVNNFNSPPYIAIDQAIVSY